MRDDYKDINYYTKGDILNLHKKVFYPLSKLNRNWIVDQVQNFPEDKIFLYVDGNRNVTQIVFEDYEAEEILAAIDEIISTDDIEYLWNARMRQEEFEQDIFGLPYQFGLPYSVSIFRSRTAGARIKFECSPYYDCRKFMEEDNRDYSRRPIDKISYFILPKNYVVRVTPHEMLTTNMLGRLHRIFSGYGELLE